VADTLANAGVTEANNLEVTKWPPQNTADWIQQVSRDANNDKEAQEGHVPPKDPPCTVEEVNGGEAHHREHLNQ